MTKLTLHFSDEEKFFIKLNAAAFIVGCLMIGLGRTFTMFSGFLGQF